MIFKFKKGICPEALNDLKISDFVFVLLKGKILLVPSQRKVHKVKLIFEIFVKKAFRNKLRIPYKTTYLSSTTKNCSAS